MKGKRKFYRFKKKYEQCFQLTVTAVLQELILLVFFENKIAVFVPSTIIFMNNV